MAYALGVPLTDGEDVLDAKLNGPKPHPSLGANLLRTLGVEK